MTYAAAEARAELLDEIAAAAGDLGHALADLGEAYELLDEASADRMEEAIFRPVQAAYARALRTAEEFAARHGLQTDAPPEATPGAPSRGARGMLEDAFAAAEGADARLAELQDSMRPVEVGDVELRSGLSEVRLTIDRTRPAARDLLRTLGR